MKFKLTEVKHKLWPINNKVIIIKQNNNLTDNGNFMVSFMLNVVKFLLVYRHLQNIYWFKRGIHTCHLSQSSGSRIALSQGQATHIAHAMIYYIPRLQEDTIPPMYTDIIFPVVNVMRCLFSPGT